LNIEKSKTDIYREGKDVIISATNLKADNSISLAVV
jgi:hypothetical protein